MSISFQSLYDNAKMLDELRAATIGQLQLIKGNNEAQFDFSVPVPGINMTLADIDARIFAICNLITGLKDENSADPALVPQTSIEEITTILDSLVQKYKEINDDLKGIDDNDGPGELDLSAFSVTSANGHIVVSFAETLKGLWDHSETFLSKFHPLTNVLLGKGYIDFSNALKTLSDAVEQIHKHRSKARGYEKAAQNAEEKIKSMLKQADPSLKEITRLKDESEKDRKSLSEYTVEGTQSISAIRQTKEEAELLLATVTGYKLQFDRFQNELDAREKAFTNGNMKQEELLGKLFEDESKITDLRKQSEAMLTGATVAGLASSFGKLRDEVSGELTSARRTFYLSIFLLFLSVIPLVGYVLPGLATIVGLSVLATSEPTVGAGTLEFFGQILVRALLLLPAAWLAKFAATRHAVLFRLKEHYAYKYSVASSVEGFKKQAEPYKDELAAATFYELTSNPAERMETKGEEERHPNPLMEKLMKKMGMTFDGK